jgi:hypothetical protein
MLRLPPNPPHVRVPTEEEMRFGSRNARVAMSWREENCETCRGTKSFKMWAGVPLSSAVVEYECDCVEQMLLDRWLGVRGVPKNLRTRGFNDAAWISKDTRVSLGPWTKNTADMVHYRQGVVITGPQGSGKNLVASLMQREILSAGIEATHIEVSFFTSLVDDWRNEDIRRWYRRSVRERPVLFVTRIGVPQISLNEWGEARLAELFEYRLSNNMLTVIESAVGIPELIGRMPYLATSVGRFDHIEVKSPTPYPAMDITNAEQQHGIRRPVVMR